MVPSPVWSSGRISSPRRGQGFKQEQGWSKVRARLPQNPELARPQDPHPRLWPKAFMCPDSNGSGLWSPGLDTSHPAAGPRCTSCQGLPQPSRACPHLCPAHLLLTGGEDELRSSGVQTPAPRGCGDYIPTGDSSATTPGGESPRHPSSHPTGLPAYHPPREPRNAQMNVGEALPPTRLCQLRAWVPGLRSTLAQGRPGVTRGDRRHSAPGEESAKQIQMPPCPLPTQLSSCTRFSAVGPGSGPALPLEASGLMGGEPISASHPPAQTMREPQTPPPWGPRQVPGHALT